MKKADAIIAKARKEIVDFICFEAPLLYKKLDWIYDPEEDENYLITTGDLGKPLYITVEVDNSYLDVEERSYEAIEISEVIVSPDGEVWVTNEDGDDWGADEISLEELAAIANAMEETYEKK